MADNNILGGWKKLYEFLRTLRGEASEEIIHDIKKLESLYKQDIHLINHIIFLRRCKKHGIMPKGLQLTEFPRRFGPHEKMNKMQQHTESRLLSCMININYTKSNKVQIDITKLRSRIRSAIPSLWNWPEEEIKKKYSKTLIVFIPPFNSQKRKKLTKNDSSLGHYVYRKPTQTCQYLNFRSFHPRAHKIGVIDTLLTRAIRLSDDEHVKDEIQLTKIILMKNEYPPSLINDRLRRVEKKCLQPRPNNKKDEEVKKRIILPWTGDVTSKIASYLRNKMDLDIGYFPGPKIGSIICNAKQKLEKPRAGVYSMQCNSCPAVYIGETERDFMIRITEHQNDIRRESTTSPVAAHMIENDHQLDPNSFKLVVPEQRRFFRKFKEALHIKKLTNKINISNGVNINPIWSSTLLNFL
ncbi:hypothetical protein Fcan01_26635 [Folsomia candida]|uniref:Helix-turn-helix domain-containing protein n=1 Tax=Folsomia candida TaxID=158441 RepID=A0A226CZ61_FOLCA|nr:hypothetical protein Fcan01_26635 [Folsomia candida]